MKPSEVKEIYVEACRAKRRVPENGEAESWVKALALLDAADVRSALDAWWANTTTDHNGRPRGSFMPSPSDLIPLAQKAHREIQTARTQHTILARWQCKNCHVFIAGWIDPLDYKRRYCRGLPEGKILDGTICGGDMIETHRDAA